MTMRYSDNHEVDRSISTRHEARNSLRRFKGTPAYRQMLQSTISDSAKRETRAGNEHERRKARLDRMQATLELETLTTGGTPDEFTGLMSLPDPLNMEG